LAWFHARTDRFTCFGGYPNEELDEPARDLLPRLASRDEAAKAFERLKPKDDDGEAAIIGACIRAHSCSIARVAGDLRAVPALGHQEKVGLDGREQVVANRRRLRLAGLNGTAGGVESAESRMNWVVSAVLALPAGRNGLWIGLTASLRNRVTAASRALRSIEAASA
jgi:hypothetical protein